MKNRGRNSKLRKNIKDTEITTRDEVFFNSSMEEKLRKSY